MSLILSIATDSLNEQTVTLVLIPDTHSCHGSLVPSPEGDFLIHAGDIIEHGTIKEAEGITMALNAAIPRTLSISSKTCCQGSLILHSEVFLEEI